MEHTKKAGDLEHLWEGLLNEYNLTNEKIHKAVAQGDACVERNIALYMAKLFCLFLSLQYKGWNPGFANGT